MYFDIWIYRACRRGTILNSIYALFNDVLSGYNYFLKNFHNLSSIFWIRYVENAIRLRIPLFYIFFRNISLKIKISLRSNIFTSPVCSGLSVIVIFPFFNKLIRISPRRSATLSLIGINFAEFVTLIFLFVYKKMN